MSDGIRVSVLLPTYNRPDLLREALASLVEQWNAPPYEVLVLNDGGDVPAPLRSECSVCKGLQLYDLPHRGQAATLNAGLSYARGEYITVAHDDDLVLPNKLAVLAAALDAAPPEVGAVYSLPQYTDAEGQPVETPATIREYLLAHPRLTWADVRRDGILLHGTGTMYRREALLSVGGWDEGLMTAEEFGLHLSMLRVGWVFQAVDAVTVTYRKHRGGKSQSVKKRRGLGRRAALDRIYQSVGWDEPVPATE